MSKHENVGIGHTGPVTESAEEKIRRAQRDISKAINILQSHFMVDRADLANDLENIQDTLEEAINVISK